MKIIKKIVNGYKTLRTVVIKNCDECTKEIEVLESEIKRGAGKFCSRNCYYINLKKTRPSGKYSWAWKGDKVGKEALHNWVQKHLGKPKMCDLCGTTDAKQYDWANLSQSYKRDLSDWKRMCRSCHAKYDHKTRLLKWRESVKKLGWKVR